MKHSIRYIQISYTSKGAGHSIYMLRGMETRVYDYSTRRFDAILDATNHQFKIVSKNDKISFTRVYPQEG